MDRVGRKERMIFFYWVTLVVSLALIGFSIWLHFSESATLCQKVLQKPLLILGVPMLLLSVLILVGFYCRVKFILYICVISLLLIFLGLFCLSLFGVLVTNRNASRALFGRDGNYSHYLLQKYMMNAQDWEQIKSCLVHYKFCHKYTYLHDSSLQSSCCKPPTYCGLEFHNATYWTMPKEGPAVADDDCKIWSNVQSELCFNCQSCTTSFLDQYQKHWKMLSLLYFVLSLVLNFACCVVYCCVLRKNRSNGYQTHKVYPA